MDPLRTRTLTGVGTFRPQPIPFYSALLVHDCARGLAIRSVARQGVEGQRKGEGKIGDPEPDRYLSAGRGPSFSKLFEKAKLGWSRTASPSAHLVESWWQFGSK